MNFEVQLFFLNYVTDKAEISLAERQDNQQRNRMNKKSVFVRLVGEESFNKYSY